MVAYIRHTNVDVFLRHIKPEGAMQAVPKIKDYRIVAVGLVFHYRMMNAMHTRCNQEVCQLMIGLPGQAQVAVMKIIGQLKADLVNECSPWRGAQ